MSHPDRIDSHDDQPNYRLRRAGAAGAIVLASLGVWKAGELTIDGARAVSHTITQTDYDRFGCEDTDQKEVIGDHETVWDKAAEPLADKLHIPVDRAMGILATANPNLSRLGNVPAGTVVSVPECDA